MSQHLFKQQLNVLNVGLEQFSEDLKRQNVKVTQLDWQPPAGGNEELIRALSVVEREDIAQKIEAANQQAYERIVSAQPILIGYGRAIDVVPGMTERTLLHAGPPIDWENMNGPMRGAVTGAIVFEGWAKDLKEGEKLKY